MVAIVLLKSDKLNFVYIFSGVTRAYIYYFIYIPTISLLYPHQMAPKYSTRRTNRDKFKPRVIKHGNGDFLLPSLISTD
jgi:hypothetical protein